MNDRRLIYAAAFLRALATGMAGVLLGLTLARLGSSAAAIGAVLSAGLAGATLALVIVTWAGDRLGRRRCRRRSSASRHCEMRKAAPRGGLSFWFGPGEQPGAGQKTGG